MNLGFSSSPFRLVMGQLSPYAIPFLGWIVSPVCLSGTIGLLLEAQHTPRPAALWRKAIAPYMVQPSQSCSLQRCWKCRNVAICHQLSILWDVRENCFGRCSLKKTCAPRNNWESISLGWWAAGSWPCTWELKTVPHTISGNVSFLLNSNLISLFQPPLILTW